MPFQDFSLHMVLRANPPKRATQYTKGVTLEAYVTQLVDALVAAFPHRAHDIRQRTHDLKRRFTEKAQQVYEDEFGPPSRRHYHVPGHLRPLHALPAALRERYSIKQQPDVRAEVAGVMGIADKGHESHGANFDSAQTLKQIIDNLFATVSGAQAAVVAGKVMARYGYDPR
jgi:hypothetical protein